MKSIPFWKGETFNRDFFLSQKISDFLAQADSKLTDPAWLIQLQNRHSLDKKAADHLAAFLKAQKAETGVSLPHHKHLVIERISSGPGGTPGNQVVLHTFWGGQVNRPFALALDAAWQERFGHNLEIFPGDDCIALLRRKKAAFISRICAFSGKRAYRLGQRKAAHSLGRMA